MAQSSMKPCDPTCSETNSFVLMEAQVAGAGAEHYFLSGHLCLPSSHLVAPSNYNPRGLSILVPGLKGWDGGCCCGVGLVVLSGLSSGHRDHEIHESDGCMALGLSKLICNKEVVTVLKFLPKQLTFYFLKCLSLKALESCAIFEQAPFQLDTSLATGP